MASAQCFFRADAILPKGHGRETTESANYIAQMLKDSANAVRDAVKGRLEAGQDMNLYYDHPILLLQHMVWHKGYHHGQIKLALKATGRPMRDESDADNLHQYR
jgi:uncharacterized damage-inducible protein DinB